MNSFWTVVGFTARNKFRGKAFIITTLIIALIISIGINLPYIITQFDKGESSAKQIGYIQSQQEQDAGTATGNSLKAYFDAIEGSKIKMMAFPDKGDAAQNEQLLQDSIKDGAISGYLEFGDMSDSGYPAMSYKSEKLLDISITESLQTALQNIRLQTALQDAGLSEGQLAALQAPIKITTLQIATAGSGGEGKSSAQQGVNMGLIYFIIIFLFMAIMTSGQLIASEVTAEKSSRIMEILITSVAPLKQMFGKIFGMFLVVLAQVSLYVCVMLINLSLPHNKSALSSFNIDLSAIDPMILAYSLIFFLTGFFLFATLYAAVGSIVSRTEDLGQATMPMTFISLAGFYIAMFSISTPDSLLVKVTSFIPLFSPYVMMLRLGLTGVPTWEVLVSIAILLVSIYVAVYISAKIYRTGVLMYGKRPSWKEIRKAMKAYKI
ncbi:ABC transporter permease [Paenibacillus oryzae]|uniref:ABC transporter permease n=1 Tax=Paenibacillus oryzae TaxID=1844972 RepID=A0A1A5YC67_9BACL|nr:ABC transporter permease [Paenibacillus oryzae]OBR63187.1 ABC transporter permease [Paenibacillus oryzae]